MTISSEGTERDGDVMVDVPAIKLLRGGYMDVLSWFKGKQHAAKWSYRSKIFKPNKQ